MQKECAIVAGTAYAVGLARFAGGTLGCPVSLVVITDEPEQKRRNEIIRTIQQLNPEALVLFTKNQFEIERQLLLGAPKLVFGSHLECPAARKISAPIVHVSAPMNASLALTRTYGGTHGALTLVEDIVSALMQHHFSMEKYDAPPRPDSVLKTDADTNLQSCLLDARIAPPLATNLAVLP
jgi:hypothetical protein